MKLLKSVIKSPQRKLAVAFIILLTSVAGTFAQTGNSIFNDSILHIIEFANVDVSQISIPYYKGIYQSVDMKIDGNLVSQVGLTTKGQKSYAAAQYDKRPFKIKTDKYIPGQKYNGIKRFNLHNNTYDNSVIREKLTCDAALQLGIPAPKVAFAEVYINGNYWGVYTIVEAQDEIYKRTFGDNDGYAMESFGSEAHLDNMVYYGSKPEDYKDQYIVDHGNDSVAWSLWINALYKIHTLPPRVAYVDSVSNYIDYQSFFSFNAVLDYNLNAESKNRNGIYYFNQTDKKWYTICWDQNVSFPDFGDPSQNEFPNTQMTGLLDKYSTYPQFSQAYNKTLCQLTNVIFTDLEVNAKITAYRNLIDAAVEKDTRKSFTQKQYEQSFNDLRYFIQQRNKVVFEFLKDIEYSCTTSGLDLELKKQEIQIFPVPANSFLNVVDPMNRNLDFSIINTVGTKILAGQVQNSQINISFLPSGIYVLVITHENKPLKVRKIIRSMSPNQ
jgi:spore coat protein CotH